MSNAIYYFTGTKNSLSIALKLSENIKGSKLINIFDAGTNPEYESVGLVFPVHVLDYPNAVKEFIIKNDFSGVKYIYAVCTSGGNSGNLFYNLNKLLMTKGKKLNYGFELKLADNSLIINTKPETINKRYSIAKNNLENISIDINNKTDNINCYKYSLIGSVYGKILNYAMLYYYKMNDKKIDDEKCNKCLKCIKLCPSKNICKKGDEMIFNNKCYNCFACINECPQKAISFGRISPDKYKQYKKPDFVF